MRNANLLFLGVKTREYCVQTDQKKGTSYKKILSRMYRLLIFVPFKGRMLHEQCRQVFGFKHWSKGMGMGLFYKETQRKGQLMK